MSNENKFPQIKLTSDDVDTWDYSECVLKFLTDNLREMIDMNQTQIWARANQLLLFMTYGKDGQGELDPKIEERYFADYFNK